MKNRESKKSARRDDENTEQYTKRRLAECNEARKILKSWAPEDEFTVIEEATADVISTYIVQDKKLIWTKVIDDSLSILEQVYGEDEERWEVILDATPSPVTIAEKYKTSKRFKEFVWDKVKSGAAFTQNKRFNVINALYEAATSGNVNAAKVYLQMTGDFSDSKENGRGGAGPNDTDKFTEIQKALNTPLRAVKK